VTPEQKPADPSYWNGLVKQISDGWVLEHIGSGKRHKIGRFEGIRRLGEGGFGLVLLVRDPDLDREVALKLYRVPHKGADEAILREAQLLAKISHPNVITVHETGRYGYDVFYVMERIVGMNGHKFIQHSKGWQQVIEIYIGAGTGLAVAHEHGIIHGDFKPGNILIPEDGGPVRVADFGMAQVMYEDGAGVRHRLGTLPYMAPEVLRGEPGDARSDQWSFCVALWHTLEAALPYEGETAEELLAEIEHGEPHVAEPWVPEHVRAVVRVGLSVNPKDRYPDMRTLVAALVGGVVSAIVVAPMLRPAPPTSVDEPQPEAEIPGVPTDPFVEILAHVQADEFLEADKLWRETWSGSRPKTRALTNEESFAIGLACIGRAKQLRASNAVKADEAIELATAISGRLHRNAPSTGNPIDVAIEEYERVAREP
jgi:serine/threonine protein kinase